MSLGGGPPGPGIVDTEDCFIATAAYGTPFAREIDVLRLYRDKSLKTNHMGRALVKLYYQNSPPFAHYISDKEGLRKIVRQVLSPIVDFLRKYQISK